MQLFLHIEVSEKMPVFSDKLAGFKKELPNCSFYDVDNHSDALVVDTAAKAIDSASSVFVFVEADKTQPGPILRLIKALAGFEKEHPIQIVYNGNNPMLDKLERGFKNKWENGLSKEMVVDKAQRFFETVLSG